MNDLDQRLQQLGDSLDAPTTPLAEDLARGRATLRRQRLVIGGASLGTAAVMALGSTLLFGGGEEPRSAGYAGNGSGTPPPSMTVSPPSATPSDPEAETSPPETPSDPEGGTDQQPSADQGVPGPDSWNDPEMKVLVGWNDVLAENLDPRREHLSPMTEQNWNVQSGGSLGSKYTWTNPGESGTGMLQVAVMPAGGEWIDTPCAFDYHCTPVALPRGVQGKAVGKAADGLLTVIVTRPDGEQVSLTLDFLFGNNATTPIRGSDLTLEDIARAAADERITLP